MIRLVTSKLHCMAAAVEATSPQHTSGTSAECPPPLLNYLPGSPDSHVHSTKLQARSKLHLKTSCLLPERFQRSGAGMMVAAGGFSRGTCPSDWAEGSVPHLPFLPGMNFCLCAWRECGVSMHGVGSALPRDVGTSC